MITGEIIEYGIAAGETYSQLAGLVNEQIKVGFQPFEKPFSATHGEQSMLYQAMVRYASIKKKPVKKKA